MSSTVLQTEERALSSLARGLTGSEILKISAEVRTLCDQGRDICNLTVGDFSPKEFRIPARLEQLIRQMLVNGETNYPPSDGTKEARQAVVAFFRDSLGLDYGLESTLIAGGARPIIFAAYAAVVDPGDKVVYAIPSWNNNHYTYLTGAVPVEISVGAESRKKKKDESIRPHMRAARQICIATHLDPIAALS